MGVRWVSSSARSVKAVWNNYPALVQHFQEASVDPNRSAKERLRYGKLKQTMTDKSFVYNTGILLDALTELEGLSLELQKRSTQIQKAHKLLEMKCRVFHSMRFSGGEYASKAALAWDESCFNGSVLHVGNVRQLDRNKFFECLCNNLEKRMYTTISSRVSRQNENDTNESKYVELLEELNIFDPKTWPEEPSITFGDEKIHKLCRKFNIEDKIKQKAVDAFRAAVYDQTENDTEINFRNYADLAPLLSVINTLIISTAECERSFTVMNDILTPTRNALSVQTVRISFFLLDLSIVNFMVSIYG